MRLKNRVHSSRFGGPDFASLDSGSLSGVTVAFVVLDMRVPRLRGDAESGGRVSASPLSFPAISASGIESPELITGGTSNGVPAPVTVSAGNGSEIPSSTSIASESMTMRGSVDSSPRASAASGVIPLPGIG